MKLRTAITAIFLATAAVARAVDGAPALIDYQGVVLDASGNPVAAGTPENIEMYFRVWNHISDPAAANLLWGEKQVVTVLDGQFSVRLGEGDQIQSSAGDNVITAGIDDPRPSLLTAFNGTDRFIGVSVAPSSVTKPNAEIQPRLAFLSSPFAMVAQTAKFAESGPTGGVFQSAQIGINGVSAPIAPLHVGGSAAFGNAFTPDGDNSGNILNIMSGANNNGASNGIAFFENPAGLSMSLGYDGTGNTTTDALKFYNSSGAAIMTLQNDGKVGIGTAAPLSKLHVSKGVSTGVPSDPDAIATFENSGEGYINVNTPAANNAGLLFGRPTNFADGGIFYLSGQNMQFRTNGNVPRMTVTKTGNVGIGTTNPLTNLHISSADLHKLRLEQTQPGPFGMSMLDETGSTRCFFGATHSGGDVITGTAKGDVALVAYNGKKLMFSAIGAPSNQEPLGMTIVGNRVGIGTTSPTSALTVGFSNIVGDVAIGTPGGVPGFSVKPNVGTLKHAIKFRDDGIALDPQGGTEEFFVSNNGNVGIGTTNPVYKLQVGGLVYSSAGMYAPFFTTFSDGRIKDVTGRSDGTSDLEKLLQIEVTDYTLRDKLHFDAGPQKKVVAQQVEKVYPLAISRSAGAIPDIYQSAPVKDGWIQLETDLKVGDRVRLRIGHSESSQQVTAVSDGRFHTDSTTDENEIFVFGREVDDLRSVDYDAIAMLNVSATQEIHRKLEIEQQKNAALETRLAKLEAMMATLAQSEDTPPSAQ